VGGYALEKSHGGGILRANVFLFMIRFYFSGSVDLYSILIYLSIDAPLVVFLSETPGKTWITLAMSFNS